MGYFDFLSPDLQDQQVADDEETNRQAQEKERNPDFSARSSDFPKWQRRKTSFDESATVKQEQNAIRQAHEILKIATTPDPENPGQADSDLIQVRNALDSGALTPTQLVMDLEQIVKKRGGRAPGLVEGLSSALSNLKITQQQRSAQAQQLAVTPQADQTPPEVYAGQAKEAFDQAAKLRTEAQSMGILGRGEKLAQATNLEAQAKSLEAKGPQAGTAGNPDEMDELQSLDLHGSIDANLKAAGKDPRTFRVAMIAAAKKLEEATGVDTNNLKDQIPFNQGLGTALQLFDPDGNILKMLAQDMAAGTTAPEQKTTKPGADGIQTDNAAKEDLYTKNIRNMQAQRRQLYAQLGQTPELQSWLGVLAFVFLSIASRSPAVAASILGISARQGNLKSQLDLIDKEMHEEADLLRAQRRRTDQQRQMAASHALHRQDKQEDFEMELQKMYLKNSLIIKQKIKADPTREPMYKKMMHDYTQFNREISRAHGDMRDAQRAMDQPFVDDQVKKDALERKRDAIRRYNIFGQKLSDLDDQIEKYIGGPAPEAVTPPQEGE